MTICRFGHQVLFQCCFDPVTKDPLLIKATIRSKEMPLHQTLVFICSYKGELIRPLIDRPRQRKRKGGDHHCQMIVKCNKSWFSPTVYDQSTLGQCYHILKKLWSLKEIKVSLKAEKPLLFISEFKTLHYGLLALKKMGNRKIYQNYFLAPHFLKALLFQMKNICSRCVVSFTFNIYLCTSWLFMSNLTN